MLDRLGVRMNLKDPYSDRNPMHFVNIEKNHCETGHQTTDMPVWVRMTGPNSAEFYTGMKRGTLYNLCVPGKANKRKPPVLSKRVAVDLSKKRGTRLIHLQSLLDFIYRLP